MAVCDVPLSLLHDVDLCLLSSILSLKDQRVTVVLYLGSSYKYMIEFHVANTVTWQWETVDISWRFAIDKGTARIVSDSFCRHILPFSIGALIVVCIYFGITSGQASFPVLIVKEVRVVSWRKKLAWSQWNPSHLLPDLGTVKGTGLFM